MKRGFLLAVLGLCVSLLPVASRADGPPPAPSLTSPSGTGVTATPTYSWSAAPGAEDYYLWVNNAAGVPVVQSWHAASSTCAGNTCSVTPATSLSRGPCTWWVQARNSSGSGPWSAGMGFTVGTPPAAPAIVSPSGAGVSPTPTYTWNVVPDTDQYSLWVNNSSGAPVTQASIGAATCAGAVCTTTPAVALLPGAHTWWLQARNASGDGPWSAGLGFTVGSLPPAATLVGPAGAGASTTPTYTWNAVDGVTEYNLWVNSQAGTPVVQTWLAASAACVGAVCSTTPSTTLAPGSHSWWIRTRNASGDGPWSAGMGFTVGELPGAATLVAPTGPGATASPTYSWQSVAGATHYSLWVNNAAGTPVIQGWHAAAEVCVAESCSLVPAQALARGAYTWWIQARNASGDGVWSAGMAFTVGELPGSPTPRAPAGPVATASPTYAWDPVPDTGDYYLWVNNPSGTPVVQLHYAAEAVCTEEACSAKPALALGGGGHTWWVQARNGSGEGLWSAGMSFSVIATGAVAAGGAHSLALTTERNLWAWGANWTGQLGLGSTADTPQPTQVGGVSDLVAVAGGDGHTVALRGDGTVWAAGYNGDGQLGQPGGDSTVFLQVPGLTGVVQIASGGSHVLALKADGTVVAWGGNWSGQLGDGSFESAFSPVTVAGLTGVVAVAAGVEHSLALKADGTVVAWGGGWSGQLGDGTTDSRPTPAPVPGLSGIVRIASGPAAEHAFAVGAGGSVYAWGANWSGQLGEGTTDARLTPVLVPGLTAVTHLAAGGLHSLAVRQDGSLWSWGDNSSGQLGTGIGGIQPTPAMLASPTGVVAIGGGNQHSVALTSDGRVLSWGNNSNAQLGTGEAGPPASTPIELSGPGFQWQTIAPTITPGGGAFANALDALISCTTTGATIHYTTNGSDPTEASPAITTGDMLHVGESMTIRARAWREGFSPSATVTAVFALELAAPTANPPAGSYPGRVNVGLTSQTTDAELRYTTDGTEPTLASHPYEGLVTLTASTTLKVKAFHATWGPSATTAYAYTITPRVASVAGGGAFSMLLHPSGSIWTWGAGDTGQLGSGLAADNSEPARLQALTDAVAIAAGSAHALALRAGGSVAAWGANGAGQLGTAVAGGNELSPVEVPGLDRVVAIAAGGAHSLALRDDGQVYSWGSNGFGQLGDGSLDDRAVPGTVPGLANIVAVAAGQGHSLALGADGRVWAWGDNTRGQIGDGSGVNQPTPVEVLADVVSISAGAEHSLAIKKDASGWSWGRNDWGQLGTGANAGDNGLPAPVIRQVSCDPDFGCQEAAFTDAKTLAGGGLHTLGLRADGQVWSGGANGEGQLGHVTSGWSNWLALVAGLHDLAAVAPGGSHNLAVTATGVVWAWGDGSRGQLGDCTNDSEASPLQVSGPGLAFFGCRPPIPTFSVPDGTYTVDDGLVVQLSSPVHGALIRYTMDGSDPDENAPSVVAGGSLSVFEGVTLKARAWDSQGRTGDVATAVYMLRAATPTFFPPGGDYPGPEAVTISSSTGSAVVHFTANGSMPTDASPTCCDGVGVVVATTSTLTAIALPQRQGWLPSDTATATYRMHLGVGPPPAFSPTPGTYSTNLAVVISTIPGGVIHYTSDGSSPTAESPVYVAPIRVDSPTTIRAFVVHSDFEASPIASAAYVLKPPRPGLSLGTGSYQGPRAVVVELPDWDGSMHFTTSGVDPTLADAAIASGATIQVNQSLPLKVRAFKPGWLPGAVAAANYSIFENAVAPLTAMPPGGGYVTPVDVALETTTPGVVVRYTLDGTEPSAASPVYSGPLHIEGTTLLKARAFRGGWEPSGTLSEGYRFDAGRLAAPVLSPPPGIYATARRVHASCEAPGATLRYTLDGTEPTETSPSLATAEDIPVGHTLRVRVRAFKEGWPSSEARTGDYVITGAVAAGSAHSLALRADGTTFAWGANAAGQLGDGTNEGRTVPVNLATLHDIQMIAAGRTHSLALQEDGTLLAWGANDHGQLGDGTLEPRSSPVPVTGGWLSPIVAISAGDDSSFALTSDGALWSWGASSDGQLGGGTPGDRQAPLQTVGLPPIVAVVAGAGHVLALDNVGGVWAWGRNGDGQLGDGSNLSRPQPQRVFFAGSPGPTIVRLGAGRAHSLALDAAGGVWTWGANGWNELGRTLSSPSQPAPGIVASSTPFRAIVGGGSFSLSIAATGQVLAWGRNDTGQLGDGSSSVGVGPQPVLDLEEAMAVAAGDRHGLAVTADGRLWSWGANDAGQLGDGTTGTRRMPGQPALDRLVENEVVEQDPDGDGLSTAVEYRSGTDPYDFDTNDDGVPDGVAAGGGIDSLAPDTDGDGLSNDDERMLGTNPLVKDTDGDGFSDGFDLFPLDPTRWSTALPTTGDVTPPTITIWEPRNAVRIP